MGTSGGNAARQTGDQAMRVGKFVAAAERNYRAEGTNICGILVHVRADKRDTACRALGALAGVEISQETDDGRLIVVVEDTADEWAGHILTRIPTIEGVLSTSLIYHHCEAGDLDQGVRSMTLTRRDFIKANAVAATAAATGLPLTVATPNDDRPDAQSSLIFGAQ